MKTHNFTKLTRLLVMVMTLCILTSCAGATGTGSSDSKDSGKLSGELDVMIWLPEAPELLEDQMSMFEDAYPDIDINLQMMTGNGIVENLQPRLAAGNLPDVFSTDPMAFTYDLADTGLIIDIGDTKAFQDMFPSLQTAWTSPGGVKFGVGAGIATQFLYYNKEKFTEAGIDELPGNWDELMAVCQKLKSSGTTPFVWFGGSQNLLTIGAFSLGIGNKVLKNDPGLIDELANTAYDYGTQDWIDLFSQMKSVVDLGYINDGFMSTDFANGMKLFTDGDVAMILQGSWVAASILEEVPFECGIMLPPWNDAGETLVPQVATETGYSIASNENVEMSKILYDYITYETYYMYQNNFMSIPPFKNPVGEMKSDPRVDEIAAQLSDFTANIPFSANIIPDPVHEVVGKFIQDIYLGDASPADAGTVLNGVQADFISSKK